MNIDEITEYNARQYDLMLGALDAFDKKAIALGKLVSTLDGLLSALKDVDKEWKDAALKQWGVLEDVLAVALDRGVKEIPSEHMIIAKRAIGEFRNLVAQGLARNNSRRPPA